MTIKNVIYTFIIGGLSGAILDQFHVLNGVLTYTAPGIINQPLWVAPQFGVAFTIILIASFMISKQISLHVSQLTYEQNFKKLIPASIFLFIASYLITAFLKNSNLIIVLLTFLFLISLALMPKSANFKRHTLIMAILLAIGGSFYEMSLTKFSVFHYNVNTIHGIPYWLPFLYINGAFAAVVLGRFVLFQSTNKSA